MHKFCDLNKNKMLYSYNLPIEISENLCYNGITKEDRPVNK